MKKNIVLFLLFSAVTFAQNSISDYKYIIVPKKFQTFNKEDKHETSSLIQFLLNKKGYTAILSDEPYPDELAKNVCLGLHVALKDNSGILSTKTIFEFRNCGNIVVLTSEEGVSRSKDYKRAYHEAIRNSFVNIKPHKKSKSTLTTSKDNSTKDQVIEINTTLEKSEAITNEYTPDRVFNEQEAVKVKKGKDRVIKLSKGELFAQPTKTGYTLTNGDSQIPFELIGTGVKDLYLLKNKKGIFYKYNQSWKAEYYKNGTKVEEIFKLKF